MVEAVHHGLVSLEDISLSASYSMGTETFMYTALRRIASFGFLDPAPALDMSSNVSAFISHLSSCSLAWAMLDGSTVSDNLYTVPSLYLLKSNTVAFCILLPFYSMLYENLSLVFALSSYGLAE